MIEEQHFLGALQLAEAMGNARSLAYGLENYRRLAGSSDPAIQEELKRLRGVRDAWVKIENEQGAGSLFNLDHTPVSEHAARGITSAAEIENARRYSDNAMGPASVSG